MGANATAAPLRVCYSVVDPPWPVYGCMKPACSKNTASYASAFATNANPPSKLTVDGIVDDAVARGIEKDGLFERLVR
jgi:hypothetical protein